MYEPGETIKRYMDLFPASVTPWAAPLPVTRAGEAQSVMLRIIVTERLLTFGWQSGQNVNRLDIDITEEQAEQVGITGGTVAGLTVGRRGGCRCNANQLAGWDPFPGVNLVSAGHATLRGNDATYGLPSPRYTRI
jgi:hypothetical protein